MNGRLSWKLGIALGVVAVATSVTSRKAHAYPFYFDVQGGMARYMDTSTPLFNSGVSGSSDLGLDFAFGLFYTPIEPHNGFDFQIGIQNLYTTATEATSYYSTFIPYGAVRVQMWMAYASLGLSPFVWRRSEESSGLDNLGKAPSTLAYLTEIGLLYPATPKFSMGGSLTLQWFTSSGVFSAQPAASINVVMRFYFNMFGIGQDGPGQANPLEFEGWRYIGK